MPSTLADDTQHDYDFLVRNSAFEWLISRITAILALSSEVKTDLSTRAALLECIGNSDHFSLHTKWSLGAFFESQYEDPEHVELASVVCICGTLSVAQAVSVGQYIGMVWPDLGDAVLKGMSAALKNISGRQKGKLGRKYLVLRDENYAPKFKWLTTTDSLSSWWWCIYDHFAGRRYTHRHQCKPRCGTRGLRDHRVAGDRMSSLSIARTDRSVYAHRDHRTRRFHFFLFHRIRD